jgi:hypothetical protein
MAFCVKCGNQLAENQKFCIKCGTAVSDAAPQQTAPVQSSKDGEAVQPQPRTVTVGQVKKCPACGSPVESFQGRCPSCGHEINVAQIASSLQTFVEKLENQYDDESKLSLIESFPIPNTKEDLLEFMLMASSNIKPVNGIASVGYGYLRVLTFGIWKGPIVNRYNTAWKIKCKQAYSKAKIVLAGDKNLPQFDALMNEISKSEKRTRITIIITILVFVVFVIVSINT